MTYHSFVNPETNEAYGSFLVEYVACDPYLEPGWYWYACWPGCIPDGEPNGPFDSSKDAMQDARSGQ